MQNRRKCRKIERKRGEIRSYCLHIYCIHRVWINALNKVTNGIRQISLVYSAHTAQSTVTAGTDCRPLKCSNSLHVTREIERVAIRAPSDVHHDREQQWSMDRLNDSMYLFTVANSHRRTRILLCLLWVHRHSCCRFIISYFCVALFLIKFILHLNGQANEFHIQMIHMHRSCPHYHRPYEGRKNLYNFVS